MNAIRRTPLLAVLALTAGLTGSLILLAVIDATILRPLPGVASPGDLAILDERLSYPSVVFFAAAAQPGTGLAGAAAYSHRTLALAGEGGDRRVLGTVVTGDYFAVAGARAARGRLLGRADDQPGAPLVAVLTEKTARDLFGADDALGRTLSLNGATFVVVGVAAPEFRGLERLRSPALWVSVQSWMATAPASYAGLDLQRFGWSWLRPIVRLEESGALARAQAAIDAEAARQAAAHPSSVDSSFAPRLAPALLAATGLPSVAAARGVAAALAAAVCLLIGLAGASAAHLFLTRAEARRHELATRMALGAARGRLAWLLVVEPLAAALVATPLALLIASRTLALLAWQRLPDGMRLGELGLAIDLRVALAGGLLAGLTGIAAGLLPLRRLLRTDLGQSLIGRTVGARGGSRGRAWLVATQVAISLVLVASSSLCLRALARAAEVDTGFDGERLAFVALDAALARQPGSVVPRYREALAATAALPEVEAAALVSALPLNPDGNVEALVVEGYVPVPGEAPEIEPSLVGAGGLSVLGIDLLAGRDIGSEDRAGGERSAVISAAAARHFFAGRDPLGARFTVRNLEFTVVGVARDVHAHGLDALQAPAAYLAWEQMPDSLLQVPMTVVFRARTQPGVALPAVDRAIGAAIPGIPRDSGTFADLYAATTAPERLGGALSGLFAVVGLVLAAIGLFGLVSQAAAQRAREIGVRVALGATRGGIMRLMAAAALRPALLGVLAGLPLAVGVALAARGLIFGLAGLDVAAPLMAAICLLVTALAAASWPAWRAAGRDPVRALRDE